MKILYVKSNSQRAKKYQLQTIIYEESGKKFVKKKALCEEAIPHLMSMQQKYEKLTASIINRDIRLAKILKVESDALIFEFIEGISLEEKIVDALKAQRGDLVEEVISSYLDMVESGFKTSVGISQVSYSHKETSLFERFNFSKLANSRFFESLSNIDLIFSNIIYKENIVYIIDYEWVFDAALPTSYSLYRALRSLHSTVGLDVASYFSGEAYKLFEQIESELIFFEIMSPKSFYQFQERFAKNRQNLYTLRETLDEEIVLLNGEVVLLNGEIDSLRDEVKELHDEMVYYALSRSWKITRPMRKFFTYIRGLR